MIWTWMSSERYVERTISGAKYQEITKKSLKPSAKDFYQNMNYIFHGLEHMAKTTKKWFGDNITKVLSWPPNSQDTNFTEILWHKMMKLGELW